MRAAVFFLCLLFSLLTGGMPACAGIRAHAPAAAQAMPATPAAGARTGHHGMFLAVDQGHDQQPVFFLADDAEEEDSSNFPAPKDRLPARAHPLPVFRYYPAAVSYRCNCYRSPAPFTSQLADKYLRQGVLRI